MPGEGDRLHRHTFLHAAVAGEADDVVIENLVVFRVEPRLGHLRRDRHADAVRHALTERSRGGLDAARGVSQFGVTRCLGAELPEAFDLLKRHVRVTAQVQPRVEEHRAVAGAEHEAVAVEPLGMIGAMMQRVAEKHGADFRAAERQAEMTAVAGVNGVHGEAARGVGGLGENFLVRQAHKGSVECGVRNAE